MKLLLVSNMYPSDQFPSYGVFVKNTELILTNQGYTLEKVVLTKQTSKFQKLVGYATHYAKIVGKLLTNHYDAVYVHYAAHNSFPLLLVKALKPSVRIVTNVHGSDVVPEVPSQEKFQKYVRALLKKSHMIITPSHYYKQLVQQTYGVDTPIHVFPSGGVNHDLFHPRDFERQADLQHFGLDPQFRYFGFVGRLDVGKGWDHLLDGYARLLQAAPELKRSHRLIVVGAGKDSDAYVKRAKANGVVDYIDYFPLLNQQELAMMYPLFDLFIFPTTRKGESLGLVGLEAMASGTPILASRMGGILDYVKDGSNSWLFNPGDANDLAKQWMRIIELSPEQRQTVVEHARRTAKEYDPEVVKHKLTTIFEQI